MKDMKFRTTVETEMPEIKIHPESKICLIGSCFADHIGKRMEQAGLDVHVNPFGVLYNPLSISDIIRTMCTWKDAGEYAAFPCFESDGMWHSWLNDSSFSREKEETFRQHLYEVYHEEFERLQCLDMLFVTLGTNRFYSLKESGMVVGNCHKMPSCEFEERDADVEAVVGELSMMLNMLWRHNPSLKVVFTVSPYRYAKYGFHESQLSKAVLLLAVDALCQRYAGRCHYFPAYEILLDELRDYRFYAEDMLHPSSLAVEYIWECFKDTCFTLEARNFAEEWSAVEKSLSHRPIHPDSDKHRAFVRQTMLKLERLVEKYPNLVHRQAYLKLMECNK